MTLIVLPDGRRNTWQIKGNKLDGSASLVVDVDDDDVTDARCGWWSDAEVEEEAEAAEGVGELETGDGAATTLVSRCSCCC